MGTLPFPAHEPGAWDTLILGGRLWPGICKVRVKRGRKIDRKQGPGMHGEDVKIQGAKAADVDITVRCWTAEQWSELEDAIASVEPQRDQKKAPEPLIVVHPVMFARGITAIQVQDIDGPNWEKGFMTVTLQCVEYFPVPKKNATSSPSGATSGWYAVDSKGNSVKGTEPTSDALVSKSPSKSNLKA